MMKRLLQELRTGSAVDAIEAAKRLGYDEEISVQPLIEAIVEGQALQNRVAAAYALGLRCGESKLSRQEASKGIRCLSQVGGDTQLDAELRGQALEGLGNCCWLTDAHPVWKEVLHVLQSALAEEDPGVVFWACFAAGTLRMRELEPQLEELAKRDERVCPGWWRVADEASDAIDHMYGRESPDRRPIRAEPD